MSFNKIKTQVEARMNFLAKHELFTVSIEKDVLYTSYLEALPQELRQEHTCSCCRHFINTYGNIVAIVNGKIETLWDFEVEAPYNYVPLELADLVRASSIEAPFVSKFPKLGTDFNLQRLDDKIIRWEHFFVVLPKARVYTGSESEASFIGTTQSQHGVYKRGLDEISLDSALTVLDLVQQNTLYRGQDYKQALESFIKDKRVYDLLDSGEPKELYSWETFHISKTIRNTAIGTLLCDLSSGRELESAVKAFESIVAPQNYKRPTAIVTQSMITKAQEEIVALGYRSSLERRFAIVDDIPVNKVLFVNREKEKKDIFDELVHSADITTKSLSRIDEVSIDTFIKDFLPTADKIEVLFEERHKGNLVSLVAPVDPNAPILFPWDNGISWSYNGNMADSVKERVKAAGGTVEGDLRVSLEWFNYDDLDLHLEEPNGNTICYSNKRSLTGGFLDIDMNVDPTSREAVENIIFPDRSRPLEGTYTVYVHNFTHRENIDVGFSIELESKGETISLGYPKMVKGKERVKVATFMYSRANGITNVVTTLSDREIPSKEFWGINTKRFHNVSLLTLSPNAWSDTVYGNKHYMFIIDGVTNTTDCRGFFNEQLKSELITHKRVFELLGARLKVEPTEGQLSGLGFSSTKRDHVIIRVTGKFQRTIKVLI
jgi:hypothetical protein